VIDIVPRGNFQITLLVLILLLSWLSLATIGSPPISTSPSFCSYNSNTSPRSHSLAQSPPLSLARYTHSFTFFQHFTFSSPLVTPFNTSFQHSIPHFFHPFLHFTVLHLTPSPSHPFSISVSPSSTHSSSSHPSSYIHLSPLHTFISRLKAFTHSPLFHPSLHTHHITCISSSHDHPLLLIHLYPFLILIILNIVDALSEMASHLPTNFRHIPANGTWK
jgi:hypothetical protein